MDISIIITVFNAKAYILKTLNSILNQTYKFYEVIIIDDGSEDNTVQVINEFINTNNLTHFKLFCFAHKGRAIALNQGVAISRYDWIAILDADDLWCSNKLALQVKYMTAYHLDFLATGCALFEKDEEVNLDYTPTINNNLKNVMRINYNALLCRNLISHSSVLFRKNLARYSSVRNKQIDYELWLRLSENKTALYILPAILAYHRIHDGQSFEGRNRFWYCAGTSWLQMTYCIKNYKIYPLFYVMAKFFYYMLVNRKKKLASLQKKPANAKISET